MEKVYSITKTTTKEVLDDIESFITNLNKFNKNTIRNINYSYEIEIKKEGKDTSAILTLTKNEK